jgi:hypothetical protein
VSDGNLVFSAFKQVVSAGASVFGSLGGEESASRNFGWRCADGG